MLRRSGTFRSRLPPNVMCVDITHVCLGARDALRRRLSHPPHHGGPALGSGTTPADPAAVETAKAGSGRYVGRASVLGVTGLGYAPTAALAATLACQHALQLIDARERRAPAAPLPPVLVSRPEDLEASKRTGHAGRAPNWAASVAIADSLARSRQCHNTIAAFRAGRLPSDTGHAFADAAAAAVNALPDRDTAWERGITSFLKSLPPEEAADKAKVKEHLKHAHVLPYMHRSGRGWSVVALPVAAGAMTAYGVGPKKQQAVGLALLHRAKVVELMSAAQRTKARTSEAAQHQEGSTSGVPSSSVTAQAELAPSGVPSAASSSPPDEPLDSNLIERLLTMFANSSGVSLPAWRAVDPATIPAGSKFHHVGYELSFAGTCTYGTGTTPGAAQHVALEAMHDSLAMVDDTYQAFVTAAREHPSFFDLKHAIELRMPEKIAADIRDIARPVAAAGRASLPPSTDSDGGGRGKFKAAEAGIIDDSGGTDRFLPAPWQEGGPGTAKANQAMVTERRQRMFSPAMTAMSARRSSLPIASVRSQLLDALATDRVVVLCGTTGCGKTTQVPQYILDDAIDRGNGASTSIVVTQPRRISTMSIAERIAAERSQKIGEDVGYVVRLDNRRGRHITTCTTGVLLQGLRTDPALQAVDVVIIDEVHDRSTDVDLALAFVKRALELNPRLRAVVMSATLQSSLYSSYFDGARVIEVDGQLHPVQELYLEQLRAAGAPRPKPVPKWRGGAGPSVDHALVAWAIDYAVEHPARKEANRAILVFLPGWKDLTTVQRLAAQSRAASFHTLLLHSTVDKKDQMRAFDPPPSGMVKLILATNIAESGITIDDVGAVVDAGLERVMAMQLTHEDDGRDDDFRVEDGGSQGRGAEDRGALGSVNHLQMRRISKASAQQRRGRAGRTAGGVCLRLYEQSKVGSMAPFAEPEIQRTALENVVLRVASMQLPLHAFFGSLISPPMPAHIAQAVMRLHALGAVVLPSAFNPRDKSSTISELPLTQIGGWLARIPVDPALGKLVVLGATLGCLDPALTIAACTELSPFVTSREVADRVDLARVELSDRCGSDHLVSVLAYNSLAFTSPRERRHVAAKNMLNELALFNASRVKEQLRNVLAEGGFIEPPEFHEEVRPASTLPEYNEGGGLCVDEGPASDPTCINNIPLLRAIVAAALYPNIGVARLKPNKQQRKRNNGKQEWANASDEADADAPLKIVHVRTESGEVLTLSKRSVVRAESKNPGGCRDAVIAFDRPMRIDGRNPRVNDVTQVSVWGLLILAAAPHHIRFDERLGVGRVGKWLTFRCTAECFEMLKDLRDAIFHCMARIAVSPGDHAARQRLSALRGVLGSLLEDAASVTFADDASESASDEDPGVASSGGDADDEEFAGDGGQSSSSARGWGSNHQQKAPRAARGGKFNDAVSL